MQAIRNELNRLTSESGREAQKVMKIEERSALMEKRQAVEAQKVTKIEEAAVCAAVNINTASQEELQAVKGVTAAKAKAIIDYRSKAGAFRSTDDLTKVEGISARTVDMQQLCKDASVTAHDAEE
jgi:comEA protein